MRLAGESCGRNAHLAVTLTALALALGACGQDSDQASETASGGAPATALEETSGSRPTLTPARCPAELADCRTVSGRIIYVEKVDPDGDGDAHFVLASEESLSAPGISVVDVAVDLRPEPLPGVGDQLSAAGTVARGSYGQRQIEAVELRFARRG